MPGRESGHDRPPLQRIIVPSGEVTDRATMGHNNAGTTIYDLTVTIYGDYTVITNVASIAV
jgi:hypothetical protein